MTTKDQAFLKSVGAADEQPSVTSLMHLHQIAEERMRAEFQVTERNLRAEVQTAQSRLRAEVQIANESLEAERADRRRQHVASEKHLNRIYMLLVAAALLAAWGINDALRLRAYERGCLSSTHPTPGHKDPVTRSESGAP